MCHIQAIKGCPVEGENRSATAKTTLAILDCTQNKVGRLKPACRASERVQKAGSKSPNSAKSSFSPPRPPNPDPRQRRIRSQTFQCGRCFLLPRLTRLSTALGSLRVKNMDLERRFFCKLLKLGVGQSGTTITNYFIQNILRTNRVKEEM